MRRRQFIGLASGALAAATPLPALAAERTYRIGYLSGESASGPPLPNYRAFVQRLADLGYSEGNNIKIDRRLATGNAALLPEMALDLVAQRVEVIVAAGSIAGFNAQKATKEIPIVILASHDGIGTSLYQSLAHPGGNITGIDSMAPALDVKRVEMLKQVLPQTTRLFLIYNPQFPGAKIHLETVLAAARTLNIIVQQLEVSASSDIDAATSAIQNEPNPVITIDDPLISFNRKRIIDFAIQNRIPTFHEFSNNVDEGGLASYGANLVAIWQRGAHYVDKILKGEQPRNLPVEQPTTFDLAINLKTARLLGLTFPDALLATANVVIE